MKIDPLAFVLDSLRDGPAHLDDLYREAWKRYAFPCEEVQDALRRLCVEARKRPQDGAVFVMRPANLYAIWWAKGRTHAYRFSPRNLSNAYQRASASGTASAEGSA